jgi:hypothetical protein
VSIDIPIPGGQPGIRTGPSPLPTREEVDRMFTEMAHLESPGIVRKAIEEWFLFGDGEGMNA